MKQRKIALIATLIFALSAALGAFTGVSPLCRPIRNVNAASSKVKLNKTSATMTKGKTLQLKLTGAKKKPTWKSSKPSVASVSKNGKVKAKKTGKATITATLNKKKYKCKITVKSKSTSKNTVSYSASKTDYGAVIIAKNNYSKTMSVTFTCTYYNKSGNAIDTATCSDNALEAGRQCALQGWTTKSYSSFKVNCKVEEASKYISTNASKISILSSNFDADGGVIAEVKNNGKTNEYTLIAAVYYKNGAIVGYDWGYADVKNPRSTDTVQLFHPYGADLQAISADSYKLFVNYSYSYIW